LIVVYSGENKDEKIKVIFSCRKECI